MNSASFRRVLLFILIVLMQSFIFSKLPLGAYMQPCIYILFILLLPVGYSKIKTLLWAFVLGLSIDLLSSNIIGINTAATVALAFVRPYLLKPFSPKSDVDAYTIPQLRTLGIRPFLGYAGLSVLFHQTLFFFLDAFAFYDILHTLLRIVLSMLCSTLFIVLLQALVPKRKTIAV